VALSERRRSYRNCDETKKTVPGYLPHRVASSFVKRLIADDAMKTRESNRLLVSLVTDSDFHNITFLVRKPERLAMHTALGTNHAATGAAVAVGDAV
jgi:hypothetical protein